MSKKLFPVVVFVLTAIFVLTSAVVSAQTSDDAKRKYEELVNQIREIDKEMKKATPEEYQKLLDRRNALVKEIANYKAILEGDQDTKRQIIAINKKFNNGTVALRFRRYGEAITAFNEVVTAGTELNTPLLTNLLAKAHYQAGYAFYQQKDYVKAKEALQKAFTTDNSLKEAYFMLGKVNDQLGLPDEAERAYLMAIEADSRYERAYSNLGTLYLTTDKWDKAIEEFMHVLEINPTSHQAFYYLGRAYFGKKDFANAEEALQLAIDNNGKQWSPYYYQAQTKNNLGKYNGAITAANNGLKYNKDWGGFHIELGLAYKSLGRKSLALENFEQAKKDRRFKQRAEHEIKWFDK